MYRFKDYINLSLEEKKEVKNDNDLKGVEFYQKTIEKSRKKNIPNEKLLKQINIDYILQEP